MLIDMLRTAVSLGREGDADRIMRQAVANLADLRPADPIDEGQMEALSIAALKLSEAQKSGTWAKWVLEAYRKTARVPPRTVADGMSELPRSELVALIGQLDALVEGAPTNKLSSAESDGLARLRSLRASLQEG
jgi:hypothetical protein